MSLPFLLEIGTEEIPDWMIPGALESLRLLFEKLEIPHESVTLDATPRRLVLRAEGLPARQADSEERVLGPAKSAPPQAVAGFARKQGVRPEDLAIEATPKGEYYSFVKKVAGRRDQGHSGRRRCRHHSAESTFPRPCTGPAKAGRASSGPSAGSWRCWAKRSCRSNWPACVPAP